MEDVEVLQIDGRQWVTVADAARVAGKPEITLYKARDAGRLDSIKVVERIVVDLAQVRELYPQPPSPVAGTE